MSAVAPFAADSAHAGPPPPESSDNPTPNDSGQSDAWQHMTPPPLDPEFGDPDFGGPCEACADAAAEAAAAETAAAAGGN